MNRKEITVPFGIRFLSEWKDFNFSNFPSKCIINKQLPGCGFTEYCIMNPNEDIILCSPRKMLLRNKFEQHENEVYLVVNEMDQDPAVDKDLNKDPRMSPMIAMRFKTEEEKRKEEEEKINKSKLIRERIFKEIQEYINKKTLENKPFKILVTYDSYHLIKKMLIELGVFYRFYTIVDEFQSILHDARFKSNTENSFLNELTTSPTSYFVSATPMLEKYLDMLKEFKDLPYFELNWGKEDPTRIIKPKLDVRSMKSVGTKVVEILTPFLAGNFDSIVVNRGGTPTIVFSNEIVLYVNSVNHILSIVKKMKLPYDQVNILCSDTEENRKKIKKKLGVKYTIGSIPKRGGKHKPITFCTRTVYLGADFYSTCAKSYIFSDSNIESLAVDISEDLPQILGRQRLEENPWKNSATFYYRTTCDYRKVTQEEFNDILTSKMTATKSLMNAYRTVNDGSDKYYLAKKYEKDAKNSNYKDDYVGVNIITNLCSGDKLYVPDLNQLVYINELRAFEIQQIDYKDRFTIFNKINNEQSVITQLSDDLLKFIKEYESLKMPYDKLKLLCDYSLSGSSDKVSIVNVFINQLSDSDPIKSYYTNLGPDRVRALGHNPSRIRKELGIVMFDRDKLREEIYSNFHEGDKIPVSVIKSILIEIYDRIGYKKSPKATDLNEYFEMKKILINLEDESGKKRNRVAGFELIKKLLD